MDRVPIADSRNSVCDVLRAFRLRVGALEFAVHCQLIPTAQWDRQYFPLVHRL